MVTQSIFDALRAVGNTRLVQHRDSEQRFRRRALYVAEWLSAVATRPTLSIYTHVDLSRAHAAIPGGLVGPYAVFIHGVESWKPIGGMRRRALRGASCLLTNSATTERLARAANPWLPHVCVVHLGLTGSPPIQGHWPRRPRALMLGRLDAGERYKGHDRVLDAWPVVKGAVPKAELVIAGAGSDLDRLQQRAFSERLRDVRFEGFVSDERKWELLRDSAVLVFPSTREGFGIAAIEAAVVGTPVIALQNTAISEVFGASGGAVFAEDETPRGIGHEIVALLTSRKLGETMGAAGRELVMTRYLEAHFHERVRRALGLA